MKLTELRTPDGRALQLHPRLAIVEADENTRATLQIALKNSMRPGAPSAGYVEVHGILLDLDRETLALLDLDPPPDFVLTAADIPVEAYGSSERRPRSAPEPVGTERDAVDARRQQLHVALDAVNVTHAALLAAIEERDRAAAELDVANREVAEAVASREAAGRAVEALADAIEEPIDGAEPASVAEPAREVAQQRDAWADRRAEGQRAVDAAERRVADAKVEVDQAFRAANPARLNQQDRDQLDALHEAVLDADDRANRRFGGASARRKLEEARSAERAVLDRLGLDSYSDFLLRSSMGATDPSAELRLEIARTELMDAERALTSARSVADAIPESRPTPEPISEPFVPVGGEAAARLAAATRARDDARAAEHRAYSVQQEAGTTLVDAEAKLVELSVRHDEAEQELARARVRVDAELADPAKGNGHPSNPSWSDGDSGGGAHDEIDRHLLAWLAARGQHPLADPLPIVLDDAYRQAAPDDLDALLQRLDHLADSLHVVYMTDDPKVLHWAASLPPDRAGLSVLPAADSAAPA